MIRRQDKSDGGARTLLAAALCASNDLKAAPCHIGKRLEPAFVSAFRVVP